MIAICFVSGLFLLEDFIAFAWIDRIDGLTQPLYALPEFYNTPLTCTVGGYLLLNVLVKLLGFLVIGGICMLVSVPVKNETISLSVTFAIGLLLILADVYWADSLFAFCNPVALLFFGGYFENFQALRWGDTPVFTFLLPPVIIVCEWLLLSLTTVWLGTKRWRV